MPPQDVAREVMEYIRQAEARAEAMVARAEEENRQAIRRASELANERAGSAREAARREADDIVRETVKSTEDEILRTKAEQERLIAELKARAQGKRARAIQLVEERWVKHGVR